MKELSIEEKAKAYDEAIERARDFMNGEVHYALKKGENIVCWLFPELRESEDERIKRKIKEVIDTCLNIRPQIIEEVDYLQIKKWLEKQGTPYTKKDVDDAYLKGVCDAKNEIEKQYEANYQIRKDIATFIFNYRGVIKNRAKWMDYLGIKVSFVEKQDEQKPAGEYNITGIGSKHAQGKLGEMIKRKLEMEKQGEHTKFYDSIQVGDKVTRNQDGVLVNLSQLKRVAKKDETQCEQKPQGKLALKAVKQETIDNINKAEPKDYSSIDPHYFKPTDNVEPKFHEGDNIEPIDSCLGSPRTIYKICDGWYETNRGTLNFEFENNWRLVEHRSAWSEEDEIYIENIRLAVEKQYPIAAEELISWLKSLRPQSKCAYNPYKAVVESIAEMCKHYDKASHSSLRDFYDNVKVKCKDAKEYDSLYPQNTWKSSDDV